MDDLLAFYGGELDVSALPRGIKTIYQRYLNRATTLLHNVPESSRSEFGFFHNIRLALIRSLSFNAFATPDKAAYGIAVFAGFIAQVYDTFFKLFSHPEVLPSAGNPDNEEIRQSYMLFPASLSNSAPTQVEHLLQTVYFQSLPRDPVRAELASDLALLSLEFMLQHELAHIAGGHLDYLRNHTGELCLLEFADERNNQLPADVSKAFECDADRAAGYLSSVFIGAAASTRHYRQNPTNYILNASAEETFHIWGMAIDTIFRIIEQVSRKSGMTTNSTHPHPDTRYQFFVVGAIEGIKAVYPDLERAALIGLGAAPRNCQRAWELLGWPTSSSDRLEKAHIGSKLNELLHDLSPHVRQYRPK